MNWPEAREDLRKGGRKTEAQKNQGQNEKVLLPKICPPASVELQKKKL